MGLEENKKELNVQIDDKKKKKYLIAIITSVLKTSIAVVEYAKALAPNRKSKSICNKSIKVSEEAIVHLSTIKHIEVLQFLYSALIGNSAPQYATIGKLVLREDVKKWDTDDGVKELIELMEENNKKQEEQLKQQEETRKAVEEAKKQGKKVEMIYDKDTKSVKPVIVEEKNNA